MNSQQQAQSLLTDAAAENAARQFNATSQQQQHEITPIAYRHGNDWYKPEQCAQPDTTAQISTWPPFR